MLGIFFAQGSALLQAVQTILNKKLITREDPIVVIWYTICMSLFFLVPTVFFTGGIPVLTPYFYIFLLLRITLDVFALSLYFYALKVGDVSLVAPLSSFSVVFSLLSSSIINQEIPNAMGITGIGIVILGTYLLNLPQKDRLKHVLTPFQSLYADQSARLILTSSFLYGIIYSINKAGILHSSTSFFTLSAAIGLLICFSIYLLFKYKKRTIALISQDNFKRFLPLGLIDGVKIFLFMLAVSHTYVAFADASDNTTAIYSTVLAGVIFKEKIKPRLIPIGIMIVGVLLITISS